MKNTCIRTAIAKAVVHAHGEHGVPFDKLFVQLTPQQISTMQAQYESGSECERIDFPMPPNGAWGLEAPEGKTVITISSTINLDNDKFDITVGNNGCVGDQPMTMAQLVVVLQDYGQVVGQAGDNAKVSLKVLRAGQHAKDAIGELKGKFDALLADMQETQGEWFMLNMLDANQARKALGEFIVRLQEIV